MNEIKIFEDKNQLTAFAADKIIELAENFINKHGKFTIALSGGSTPMELYKLLATDKYVRKPDWSKIFIFWGDERVVNINDEENNSFQARVALLDHIKIPSENIFPIPVQYGAEKAASLYSGTLSSFFKTDLPQFDLILLGIGEDGHTASLFPGDRVLHQKERIVDAVSIPGQKFSRVTFTVPLINNAQNIIFLVSGKSKQNALLNILEKDSDDHLIPARLINKNKGNYILWLADRQAAALLKNNNLKR